jgi:hypothetical protein
MESSKDWASRVDEWLARDHALMTDDSGWSAVLERDDLQIWRRALPDDPNHLFRWRLPIVGAPADIVFEGFVHRLLDYHKEWTREFAGGRIVESLAPNARIIHQRFEPGIPGISKRDLCSVEVVRDVAPGVKLASFRSVDHLPSEPGHERIDWWGAALCTTRADGKTSELVYLDRENQGGWFPTWLMNRTMPRYLILQAEAVSRFFEAGGPAALRTLAAA